ncbi:MULTISPECIES: sulfur carrier protein ThiS [Anaerostipes]|uniref:sulfur carrier protein ThiS n=1 Tax=Anaerostipes TaxID=207244 RepID=UPI000952893C|nr:MULTISPECIES: sulfur carrier protein ThiS [Anaerostipes]MCI5622749.1 sulfur carrier protein ThiS [Anaerostipes sp.]MDY2726672.1 sulfur carrier protein ThiS [Anaerostipes faecalis]OLR60108.1 thiamine biosynthesis protein ThiS [Anaerostipes sp. 494a]
MKVNGEMKPLETEMSLEDFLVREGYQIARIAVERNGEIVPKGEYTNVILSDADTLEVVSFVGGG